LIDRLPQRLRGLPLTHLGSSTLRTGRPAALFQTTIDTTGVGITGRSQYVATRNGQRFLIKQARPEAPPAGIVVVLDWTALVKK
jgi:hypothetical protein